MEWACTNCGRTYDEPPADVCSVCAHGTVVPATDAEPDRRAALLDRLRRALFDPGSFDAGLAETSKLVVAAFRILFVLSLFVLLAVAVSLLL